MAGHSIKTASEDALDADALAEIEAQISSGLTTPVKPYFLDAVNNHGSDVAELERRKLILRKGCGGDVMALQCFAVLSALTDDQKGWDAAVTVLREDMHPAIGLIAFRTLHRHRPDLACLPRWNALIENSASLGSLEARLIMFRQRTAYLGWLQPMAFFLYRRRIIVCAPPIILRNPKDDRLPRL